MAPDLREVITGRYGSLSRFADLIETHKSTVSRALSGRYGADTKHVLARIEQQLVADGVSAEVIRTCAPDKALDWDARLDTVIAAMELALVGDHAQTKAVLHLAIRELADLRYEG